MQGAGDSGWLAILGEGRPWRYPKSFPTVLCSSGISQSLWIRDRLVWRLESLGSHLDHFWDGGCAWRSALVNPRNGLAVGCTPAAEWASLSGCSSPAMSAASKGRCLCFTRRRIWFLNVETTNKEITEITNTLLSFYLSPCGSILRAQSKAGLVKHGKARQDDSVR